MLVLPDHHLFLPWLILSFYLLKGYIFISKSENTWEIHVLVHFKSLKMLVWSLIDSNYLMDVDFIRCFVVVCFPKHLIQHIYVINLLKLKVTTMSMQSIIYRILKWIIDQIVVVSVLNSWLILLDMTSQSGCYLNKLMIVNNYPCFSHQIFGLNSPKHKLMFNSKLDILLEMLICTNDMILILV
jgi:hypothetical protein